MIKTCPNKVRCVNRAGNCHNLPDDFDFKCFKEARKPEAVKSKSNDGLNAERLEAERIKGRTEAMEFIYELVGVYRKNDMINAAEMLEREIDDFANS